MTTIASPMATQDSTSARVADARESLARAGAHTRDHRTTHRRGRMTEWMTGVDAMVGLAIAEPVA